jgi:hypothetical protein
MGVMQADFYHFNDWDKGAEFIGSVTLDPTDGQVIVPESLVQFLTETKVGLPGRGVVTPDKGADYVRACAVTFHGSRFWAVLKDDQAQKSYERVFGRKFNPSHDERGRFATGSAQTRGWSNRGWPGASPSTPSVVTFRRTVGSSRRLAQSKTEHLRLSRPIASSSMSRIGTTPAWALPRWLAR